MEQFDLISLLLYKGTNPHIIKLQRKYFEFTKQLSQVHTFKLDSNFYSVLNNKSTKIIILPISPYEIQQFQQKHKLISKALILGDSSIHGNFLSIDKNVFKQIKIDTEDLSYLETNLRFSGYTFKTPLQLTIGEKSGVLLQKTFNTPHIPSTITVDKLLGETETQYHFFGKKTSFFVYKEDCEDPYEKEYDINATLDVESINSQLKKWKLLPHQIKGAKFLKFIKRGLLLYDTGLGKTATSIAAALDLNVDKILVVCPASLKINWKKELENFGQKSKIISGSTWDKSECKFTIINYDILNKFYNLPKRGKKDNTLKELQLEKFDLIILDEAQKLRSTKSQRSKIVSLLTDKAEYVFGLSGTLIEKNEHFYNVCKVLGITIDDLVIQGHFVQEYENYLQYMKTYCNRIEIKTKTGQKILVIPSKGRENKVENTNTKELRQRTKRYFLRLLKKDELENFISKYRIPIYFDLSLSERKEYDRYFEDFLEEKEKMGIYYSEQCEKLVSSIKLRQFVALLKVQYTANFVYDKVEDDKKCIVFTHFIEEYNKFKEIFGKDALYLESGNPEKNAKTVELFQTTDNPKILVANIQLGVGFNITAANYVVINSPDWNSDTHIQAEDRAWRLGQTEDVYVFYMLFSDTEEEIVFNRANSKMNNTNIFFNEK